MTVPILTVAGLSVALPDGGDRALAVADAAFELHRGEILCIVGASGSGKSALAAAIMGALPAGLRRTAGRIGLGDRILTDLDDKALRRIRGNRIAMIPQEPLAALNPAIRVGRQITEVLQLHAAMPARERTTRVAALLQAMQLPDRIAASYPHQLSGGQCQRIAIAMALAMNPEVLIADEPTTALDVTTQAQILALVRSLRASRDQGVVFITHDFGVVREIADRVAVMAAGQIVEIGSAAAVLRSPRHPATRALLGAVERRAPRPERSTGVPVLVATGLAKSYGAIRALAGVDLRLDAGTTLAIVGESGSGKTTLARLLVRLTTPSAGSMTIAGGDFAALAGAALRRQRRAVQMIFQDPFGALNPRRRVGGMIARAAMLAGLPRSDAIARARALIALVGLPPEAFDRRPAAFSGGQRQRIGIARALAIEPQLLIADEAVSALDVLVQRQVLDLLADLQARLGIAILFITHDLHVAAAIADRIAVMQHGRIVEEGPAVQVLGDPQSAYTKALVAAISGAKS